MKFEEREIWIKTALVLLEDLMHALCPLCIKFNMDGLTSCSECSHSLRVKELRPKIVLQKGDLAEGVPVPVTETTVLTEEIGDLREHVDLLSDGLCSRIKLLWKSVGTLEKDLEALAKRMDLVESLPRRFTSGPYSEPCVSQVSPWEIRVVLECVAQFLLRAAVHFKDEEIAREAADLHRKVTSLQKVIVQAANDESKARDGKPISWWPYTYPVQPAVILPAWTPTGTGTPPPQDADKGTGSPPPQQPGSV